jgi:hypothetical protein
MYVATFQYCYVYLIFRVAIYDYPLRFLFLYDHTLSSNLLLST